jgi:TRAP-type C4-dicarboxylate transport system substrate-binding protein
MKKSTTTKLLALLLTLTMVLALCACGSGSSSTTTSQTSAASTGEGTAASTDETYELNFYHIFAGVGHEQQWIDKAIAEVEAQTDGHLIINCISDGTMGGEDELIPQVFAGKLDMSLSGPSVWGTNGGIDQLGWSELPYIVTNYSEMNALAEILPDLTNQQLEEAGVDLYCLGAMSQGIRCLLTIDGKEVNSMADCKGLKIRVPSSDVYMSTVEAWGCSPTPMSSSQVITSLANGTIDGLESDPASITARGQQESFRYYIETNHIASLNLLMINKSNLEALPEEYQQILKDVFKEYCLEQCYDRVQANEAEVEVMKAAGVEVVSLSDEALQEFIDADTAYQQQWIEQYGVGDIVATAKEYVAANAK